MNKKNYANPLCEQVLSLTSLVDIQVENCFSGKKLKELMSIAEMFDFRKIILTGCGDSIAAAGAMATPLRLYSDTFGCAVMEPMEFTRFTSKEDLGIGEPNSPLVIAISAGGGTARMAEALEKANKLGAFSVLITNSPASKAAQSAKCCFVTDTPEMTNDFPGLRSYFANMISLISIACRLGHVRGKLGPAATVKFKDAICTYVHSYDELMKQFDEQMFELAKTWKDFERFDFIGDGEELYSALFGLEKFYECAGTLGHFDDSENWCHINYLLKNPETVGTVIFADETAKTFGKTLETIHAACGIGRPVLIISNADKCMFPKDANVCTVPKPPQGFEWLTPLMDYAPAALLAGYCGALAGHKLFNEFDPIAGEYNGEGNYFNKETMTIATSKIEIHT